MYFQVFNYPPTPTPLPTPAPDEIAMGLSFDGFSLWDSAPHSIQWWNAAGIAVDLVQAFILVLLIFACGFALMRTLSAANERINVGK